jgi:hypothetical protein
MGWSCGSSGSSCRCLKTQIPEFKPSVAPLKYFPRILFLKFIYLYVHTLFGAFLPPAPLPFPLPPSPSLPGRTCSALFFNFMSNNKKDKAFLLVEIRIAIQSDS